MRVDMNTLASATPLAARKCGFEPLSWPLRPSLSAFRGTFAITSYEWNHLAFEFKTPKEEEFNPNSPFGILFRAPGEVWFDEMTLKELKD